MSLYIGNKKIAGLYRSEDIQNASYTHAGIIQLADGLEVVVGSNDKKAITPLTLRLMLEGKTISTIDEERASILLLPNELAVSEYVAKKLQEVGTPEYSLIADYTVTEDDVSAGYTAYLFGDYLGSVTAKQKLINDIKFKTKDYIIYATFPAATASRIDIIQNTSDTKLALGTFARHGTMLSTSNRYAKIEMALKGKWTGSMAYGSAMAELTSVQNVGYRAMQTAECEVIGIQSNNVVFPVGTKFEIYGVLK